MRCEETLLESVLLEIWNAVFFHSCWSAELSEHCKIGECGLFRMLGKVVVKLRGSC